METLALRIEQHSSNAARVVEYLLTHPKVDKVIYPSLYEGEYKRRAEAYLKGGYGALLGVELKGKSDSDNEYVMSV